MNDADVIHILRSMSMTGLRVAGPILGVVLAVGVLVSLIQTITQVQEQAVIYVVKFAAVGVLLMLAGPWMLHELQTFLRDLWVRVPNVG